MIKYLVVVAMFLMLASCAGPFQFTPGGAAIATNAVTVASGLLKSLDGFYGDLVNLKLSPDYTIQATRALSIADAAATTLKQVIAGATVTDEKLNTAAGQVDGARAILREAGK